MQQTTFQRRHAAGFAKGLSVQIAPNLIHCGELYVTGSSAYKLQAYKDALEWVFTGKLNL